MNSLPEPIYSCKTPIRQHHLCRIFDFCGLLAGQRKSRLALRSLVSLSMRKLPAFTADNMPPLADVAAGSFADRHEGRGVGRHQVARLHGGCKDCVAPLGAPTGVAPSVSPCLKDKVVASGEKSVADVVANQVSVRDLKTHLSSWLARAQAGEVVEVTSHRKPIARITAVKSPEQGSADPLQAAIEAGVVSWNGQKPVFPPPIKLKGQGKLISDIVIEDRG